MPSDKTAAQKMLDEMRMKYRAWRIVPGHGKAAAEAAFTEARERADKILAESGSPEDKLEFAKYRSSRVLRKA